MNEILSYTRSDSVTHETRGCTHSFRYWDGGVGKINTCKFTANRTDSRVFFFSTGS
jgi:hypothetical protein